jgi:hypothetical protein
VERMLTVVATRRQQSRNVLGNLTARVEADLNGRKIKSAVTPRTAATGVRLLTDLVRGRSIRRGLPDLQAVGSLPVSLASHKPVPFEGEPSIGQPL